MNEWIACLNTRYQKYLLHMFFSLLFNFNNSSYFNLHSSLYNWNLVFLITENFLKLVTIFHELSVQLKISTYQNVQDISINTECHLMDPIFLNVL